MQKRKNKIKDTQYTDHPTGPNEPRLKSWPKIKKEKKTAENLLY
jgi:hypothetical protein